MKRREEYTLETVRWLQSWSNCWRCGHRGLWPTNLQAHHIARGSNRQKNNVASIVMLCSDCHNCEHRGVDARGMVGMLALKQRHDPETYDLLAVVKLWRPNCQASLVDEIRAAVEAEQKRIEEATR